MYPNHGHFGLFDIFDHSLIYNSMCLFILLITHTHYICMFPKIVGFPQKWMVKIMENPMYKWMIWGEFTHYFWKHPHWTMFPLRFAHGLLLSWSRCLAKYAGGQRQRCERSCEGESHFVRCQIRESYRCTDLPIMYLM